MQTQAKIQKWGNSAAVRLSAKTLAAAGMSAESKVEISTDKGRVIIQLPENTQEQLFNKLLAEVPDAKDVLKMVKQSLKRAIRHTNKTADKAEALIEKLERQDKS